MSSVSSLLSMAIIPLPVLTSADTTTLVGITTDITVGIGVATASISTETVASPQTTAVIDRDKINLESHQLVWLDANVNITEHTTMVTPKGLRNIH
ncbi:unnamed protein product [Didymodactylos carnosus]|uniref:Antifreeze protein n=1 Tax=Didymodactylos carnosus TaxID=1234261 RepID=A0A814KTY0_9BILA|nr:unnamed protein product [Didymodactylos carnosus]CAF1521753.1 unnamed protein product [Didymodactylos carnosus]CAF3824422.1 unnamed protein product [Didymodactylos carnosus]CAF4308653.1 unnamed protein product [Didymodactylos carnosus]